MTAGLNRANFNAVLRFVQLPQVMDQARSFFQGLLRDMKAPTGTRAPEVRTSKGTSSPAARKSDGAGIRRSRGSADQGVPNLKSDTFESAGRVFSEQELVAALPQDQREAFLALPAEQRKFLLSLDDRHQGSYAAMEPREQAFFRSVKPQDRSQYLAMPGEERAFFQGLTPEERSSYLALHLEQREIVRQSGSEGRLLLQGSEQMRALEGRAPVDVARELAPGLLAVLGQTEPGEGQPRARYAAMLDKAGTYMLNMLQRHDGHVAGARLAALHTLLDEPRLQRGLLNRLERQLIARDDAAGATDKDGLLAHSRKITSLLLEYAHQSLHPEVTHEELLSGLEAAVELSAEHAAANPPSRDDLCASDNLQFRHITD